MIITASSTGPALALNPLLAEKFENKNLAVQTYSIEKPTSTTRANIYDEIVETSTKYGIDTDTALRIAQCESSLRQYDETGDVIRGTVNALDIGVFQINERYHLNKSQKLGFDIYKSQDNIEYAMWLMKNEGNRHWNWSKPCWSKPVEA